MWLNVTSLQVIQADEENRKLIFSEKEAVWSKFSDQLNVGDIFEAKVGSVEDYGAFVHLLFPDGINSWKTFYFKFVILISQYFSLLCPNSSAGNFHLTGLVHVSEVSWDLVHDVRDILTEGDEVRVKIINIDRWFSFICLVQFLSPFIW